MENNKIIVDGQTLIDLTSDTAEDSDVMVGKVFHASDGNQTTGTFSLDSELATQDSLIQQIQEALVGKTSGGGSANLQDKDVTITENGSTSITADSGYDGLSSANVTVNVPIPEGYITTADATATATDLVDGKTAYVNGSKVTGSLPKHNLIASGITALNGDTFAIESGQFRIGNVPTLCGSDLSSMTVFAEGVAKTDSFVGVTGSASLLGNATAEDIASGKTALTENGFVTGTMTTVTIYSGSGDPTSSIGSDGDIYLKV